MRILGVSAFYHDSAAALITDGEIVAAAQEERLLARSTMRVFHATLLSTVCWKRTARSARLTMSSFTKGLFSSSNGYWKRILPLRHGDSNPLEWRCQFGLKKSSFKNAC
jgi:hypothetical protein